MAAEEKPDTIVTLKPGIWLVEVHPAFAPRIWRFTGEGFEGHGSKLKRAPVACAVTELIVKAEKLEETLLRSR